MHAIARARWQVTRSQVTIASYKIARDYLAAPLKQRHEAAPFRCVIIDESHQVQVGNHRASHALLRAACQFYAMRKPATLSRKDRFFFHPLVRLLAVLPVMLLAG